MRRLLLSLLFVSFTLVGEKQEYPDKKGDMVIEPSLYDAEDFSEGLAAVEIDGKYGYIDKNGKVVIDLKFDYAVPFSEGLAKVQIDGKEGYIDKTGKIVIKPRYDFAGDFTEGYAAVRIEGKWSYINKEGKWVSEPKKLARKKDNENSRESEGLRGGQLTLGLSVAHVNENLAENNGIGNIGYNGRIGFSLFYNIPYIKLAGIGFEWEFGGFPDEDPFEVEIGGDTRTSVEDGGYLSLFLSKLGPQLKFKENIQGFYLFPYIKIGFENSFVKRSVPEYGSEIIINEPIEDVGVNSGFFLEPALQLHINYTSGLNISYRYYLSQSSLTYKISLEYSLGGLF